VAAQLEKELGIATELVVGNSGEFTVWWDGKIVAQKAFPEPAAVVTALRAVRPDH
jgi:hypothetical protein